MLNWRHWTPSKGPVEEYLLEEALLQSMSKRELAKLLAFFASRQRLTEEDLKEYLNLM